MGTSLSRAVGSEITALSKDSCRAIILHHAKEWNKQCEQRFNAVAQLQQAVDRSWLESEVSRRRIKLDSNICMYTKESCQAIFGIDKLTYRWNDSMEKVFEKRAIPAKVVTKFQLRSICGDETMKLLPPEVTSIDRMSAITLYTASIEGTKKAPVINRRRSAGFHFPDIRANNKFPGMKSRIPSVQSMPAIPAHDNGFEEWPAEMDAKFFQMSHTERVVVAEVLQSMVDEQGPKVPPFAQHFNHLSCLHVLHNRGWTGTLQRSWDAASHRIHMVRRQLFIDIIMDWESFHKGDTVQVRDSSTAPWRIGHVVDVHPDGRRAAHAPSGPLQRVKHKEKQKSKASPSVLLIGHQKPFVWAQTRPMRDAHVEHLFRMLEHASHNGKFEDLDFYTSKATGTNVKSTQPTRKQIHAPHLVHKSAAESMIDCVALKNNIVRQEPLANDMLNFYHLDNDDRPQVSLEEFRQTVKNIITSEASGISARSNAGHDVALYLARNKTVLQFKEACKHFKRLLYLNHRIEKLFNDRLDRKNNDLVSVRQLIAILQCGDDDDPEDEGDKSSAATRTKSNSDTSKPESVDKPGRKGVTQAQDETKRGPTRRVSSIKRRASIKKKKRRRKSGPTDNTSKQSSQLPAIPLAGPTSTLPDKHKKKGKRSNNWGRMKALGFVSDTSSLTIHDVLVQHDQKAVVDWINVFRSDPDQTVTLEEFKVGLLSLPIGTTASVSDSQAKLRESKSGLLRQRRGSIAVHARGNNDSMVKVEEEALGQATIDLVERRLDMLSKLITKYNKQRYETIRVGDVVQVRDRGEKWKDGVVVRVNYNSPKSKRFFGSHAEAASAKARITYDVRPDGWDIVTTFEFVRSRDAARLAATAKKYRSQYPEITKIWEQALSSCFALDVPKGARYSAFLIFCHPSTPDDVDLDDDIWGAVPKNASRASAFVFLKAVLRLAEGMPSDRHLPYSLKGLGNSPDAMKKAESALMKTLSQKMMLTEDESGGLTATQRKGRDPKVQPSRSSSSTAAQEPVPDWLLHVYQTIKGPYKNEKIKCSKTFSCSLPRVGKVGITEEYNKLCRRLLGNRRFWINPTSTNNKFLTPLQATAMDRLVDISQYYDKTYYQRYSLGGTLGMLGKERRRRDTPEALKKLRQDAFIPQHPSVVYERLYIAGLRRLGLAINPIFQRKLQQLLTPFGAYLRHAPVKSFARMTHRLTQSEVEGGHAEKPEPKSAFNRDIVRAAAVFPSVRAMERCYHELVQTDKYGAAKLGKLLHVQNTMRATDEAHNDYFGVRFIRLYFAFDAGCTWGDLFDREETKKAWARLESDSTVGGSEQVWWVAHMPRVDHWQQSDGFRERQAVFIVEVELLIAPYLEMKLRTYIWRQVFTANNPQDLCRAFLLDSCSTSNSNDAQSHKHHTGKEDLGNEIDSILAAEFSLM